MKILAICGSLHIKSGNLALLETVAASMPPGVELVLCDALRHLPHFNPDIEAEGSARERNPLEAGAGRERCRPYRLSRVQVFSLPGVLKNGIDWVIGSASSNRKSSPLRRACPDPSAGGLGCRLSTLRCRPCARQSWAGSRLQRGRDWSLRSQRSCGRWSRRRPRRRRNQDFTGSSPRRHRMSFSSASMELPRPAAYARAQRSWPRRARTSCSASS